MKSLSLTVTLLLLLSPISTVFATPEQSSSTVKWKVETQWQLPENPIDIVHSLDGRYVFVLTSQHNVMVYTDQGVFEGSVPVDKGVKAIDLSPYAEKLYVIDSEKKTFKALTVDIVKTIDVTGSPFKGPADAPVTIVVFTDFECPYCSKVVPLLDQVAANNPENVKIVLKNTPLSIHKMAIPAAQAALAAGEQGKFWEFHDKLFAAENLTQDLIDKIAVELKLDMNKYRADLSSDKIKLLIDKDLDDAKKAGVTGTPTIFINGKLLLQQYRSPQGIQHLINKELSE